MYLRGQEGMLFKWFNRRVGLAAKFILLSSSLVIVTSLTFGWFVLRDESASERDALLRHGRSAAAMIAQNSEYGIYTEDQRSLQTIIESIANDPDLAYLFILNAEGRILQYKVASDSQLGIPALFKARGLGRAPALRQETFVNQEDGKEYIDILVPVVSEPIKQDALGFTAVRARDLKPRIVGYVHLGLTQEGMLHRMRQFFLSMVLATSVLVAAGITITSFITRRIVSPVNELNKATQDIAAGKLDRRIEIATHDELADLGRAFNDMGEQLQLYYEQAERHTGELTAAVQRMGREIVERKRTEEALTESEKKYRTLFEDSKDVIFICNLEPRFLDINRAGVQLLGYASKQELLGLDLGRIYVDPVENLKIQQMLQEQSFLKDYEVALKKKDGDRLDVLITAEAVFDAWGVMTTYRGVFHDVTEKRALEQQLIQSQKMEAVGKLAGGVAHDFNNILSAIIGFSHLALMKLPDSDPAAESVKIIAAAGERAAELTRQLLAFSRNQVLEIKVVNLNSIIENMTRMLSRMIGETVVLTLELRKPQGNILADTGQMEQVLMNLLVNARDAMPSGGSVAIATAERRLAEHEERNIGPGRYAVLTVADTGTGMPPEVQGRIFEPFFTTKGTGKGTGLGLSTVYGIVKQHNGHIVVQSEPGKGTTFKLYFPLVDRDVEITEKHQSPAPMRGTETLLIVDDEPYIRKLLRETLEPMGYRLLDAPSGEDALRISSEFRDAIDLLVTDVVLPGMNGMRLAEVLRQQRAGIKVIFISGYTDEAMASPGAGSGQVLLKKPLTPHMVMQKCREVLDRRETGGPASGRYPDLGNMRILYADDEEANRLLMQKYLERCRCTLDVCENGELAVARCKTVSYDLVLLDMKMPVMDGLSASRAIRAWEAEHGMRPVPLLALTGDGSSENIKACRDAGCTSLLTKPFRREPFLKTIGSYAPGGMQAGRGEAGGRAKRISVRGEKELEKVTPRYLQSKREDVEKLRRALAKKEYEEIHSLGHGMKGSGGSYGFHEITEIGKRLETTAKMQDADTLTALIEDLSRYLDSVDVYYE